MVTTFSKHKNEPFSGANHATASPGEKARPRVADESWVEEQKPPKTAAKTISDGDDIFETQE